LTAAACTLIMLHCTTSQAGIALPFHLTRSLSSKQLWPQSGLLQDHLAASSSVIVKHNDLKWHLYAYGMALSTASFKVHQRVALASLNTCTGKYGLNSKYYDSIYIYSAVWDENFLFCQTHNRISSVTFIIVKSSDVKLHKVVQQHTEDVMKYIICDLLKISCFHASWLRLDKVRAKKKRVLTFLAHSVSIFCE